MVNTLNTLFLLVSYGPRLQFSPVLRDQAGEYGCVAANSAGNSSLVTYSLEVLCEFTMT